MYMYKSYSQHLISIFAIMDHGNEENRMVIYRTFRRMVMSICSDHAINVAKWHRDMVKKDGTEQKAGFGLGSGYRPYQKSHMSSHI